MSIPKQWRATLETLGLYWEIYGGWQAIRSSPYILGAVVLTIAASSYWSNGAAWAQDALDIVPSLLGFSIGAFAILLIFSSDRFLSIITEKGETNSLYMTTSATFLHFIIIQVAAIIFAILSKVSGVFAPVGFFFLAYSILTAIATGLALFKLAHVYNTVSGHLQSQSGDDDRSNNGESERRRSA